MHDEQNVRVLRHPIQHRGKLWQLHLERMELLAHAPARVLQRLDKLARALVARRAEVVDVDVDWLLFEGRFGDPFGGTLWRGGGRRRRRRRSGSGSGDDEEGRALE